jgi:hypothetical protein
MKGRKIIIEVEFSDLLEKGLEKRGENVNNFIGELIHVYRKNTGQLIIPLREVDSKVKVTVYSPKQ